MASRPGVGYGLQVLDATDIDELTRQSASAANDVTFDLNGDGLVNTADVTVWIRDLFNSWVGDANLDKQFSSNDLVQMLASGTYESNSPAVWTQGDFDGNGLGNSSDLVAALSDGGYEQGPRVAAGAVPEPSAATLIALAMLALTFHRRGGPGKAA